MNVILYESGSFGETNVSFVREVNVRNVSEEDAEYFKENNIKVSMETLTTGDIVVYGCPYSDKSEESEVMVFAGNKSAVETFSILAQSCKEKFGGE